MAPRKCDIWIGLPVAHLNAVNYLVSILKWKETNTKWLNYEIIPNCWHKNCTGQRLYKMQVYFLQIHPGRVVYCVPVPWVCESLPPRPQVVWGFLRDALPHVTPSLSSHGLLSRCRQFCCHGDKTPPTIEQLPVSHHPLSQCFWCILCMI